MSVLPLLLFAAAVAQPDTYRIAGTVRDGLTGRPIAGARLSAHEASNRTRRLYAKTGSDGRFAFDGLAGGKWSIAATRRGYLSQTFGQGRTLTAGGISIVLGGAEPPVDLDFPMYPPAMITGRVTDSVGDSVENALVEVFASTVIEGRRQIIPLRSGWTNDDGAFAIGSLRAGSYYLAVTARPWYTEESRGGGFPAAFGPRFYPGTSDPRSASPIVLRAGERVDADFTLTAAQAVALTLAAKNPVIVRLSSEGIGGVPVFHHGEDSPSTIHVYNLIPGRYTVWFGPRGTDPPSIQVIDLGHQDTTIDLAPSPPARVSVECATDGARPGGLGLVITSEDNLHGAGRMIAGGPRIEYPPLSAGRYRFRLMGQGADRAYLDILSSEGGRFEDGVLEITPGESIKVRAVVSTRGGRVEGKVYRGGRPLAGAMVFLAPRRAGEQSRYPAFTTDSDGSFEYPAVKPGDYVVYAFDEDLDIEYAVPSVAERDARASRIVRVEAGGSVDLRLDLTSPQPAPASAGPQAEGR